MIRTVRSETRPFPTGEFVVALDLPSKQLIGPNGIGSIPPRSKFSGERSTLPAAPPGIEAGRAGS